MALVKYECLNYKVTISFVQMAQRKKKPCKKIERNENCREKNEGVNGQKNQGNKVLGQRRRRKCRKKEDKYETEQFCIQIVDLKKETGIFNSSKKLIFSRNLNNKSKNLLFRSFGTRIKKISSANFKML